jgi:hypothetical protein
MYNKYSRLTEIHRQQWYCGRDLSIHVGVIIVLQNRLVIEQGSITQAPCFT